MCFVRITASYQSRCFQIVEKYWFINCMSNQLTILIPTSPIPSHPSTIILDETISNIRKYTDAEIILMFDGVHLSVEHRKDDYQEYRARVIDKSLEYGHFSFISFSEHTHQAKMTRQALASIKTPLIMFCEHDTSPIGEIPFKEICDMMLTGIFNYIRFNIFDRILDEHKYLMLGDIHPVCGIPVQRTVQYSQRPHIASTDWYREILTKYFKPEDKTMIEDVMHGVIQDNYTLTGVDNFKLAIYTPEGSQLRSYHSDGRGNDEKITYG